MFNFNLCGRLTEDAEFFQINDRTNKIVFTVAGSAKKTKFLKNDVDDNGVERTKWVEKYEFKVEKFNLPDKKADKKAENSYTKTKATSSSIPF